MSVAALGGLGCIISKFCQSMLSRAHVTDALRIKCFVGMRCGHPCFIVDSFYNSMRCGHGSRDLCNLDFITTTHAYKAICAQSLCRVGSDKHGICNRLIRWPGLRNDLNICSVPYIPSPYCSLTSLLYQHLVGMAQQVQLC